MEEMNIEELRAALLETRSQLSEREEEVKTLQQNVEALTKEKTQYYGWWQEEHENSKRVLDKLVALKGIVKAI